MNSNPNTIRPKERFPPAGVQWLQTFGEDEQLLENDATTTESHPGPKGQASKARRIAKVSICSSLCELSAYRPC